MTAERTAYLLAPQIRIKPGEYRPLYDSSAAVRRRVGEAGDVLGLDLAGLLSGGTEDEVNRGVVARPAIMALSVALFESAHGPAPDYLAGISLGQITAAHLAGCLSYSDAIRMCHTMAAIEDEHFGAGPYGVYFFCNTDLDKLAALMSELDSAGLFLRPCAYLADDQMIVTGEFGALRELATRALGFGALGMVIPYGPPAHCELLVGVQRQFAERWHYRDGLRDPRIPLVCNLTTDVLDTAEQVGAALAGQYTRPVRWADSIRRMAALGVGTLVVPGPGAFVQRSLESLAVRFAVTDGATVGAS
ncbi:ACP S-malonyltransferase [Actinokineospora sp.]|uniref:ACP S-malonyltransferase n=1 Tax=Actinokineospora sp. TaxID=1872133 RepID=UPI00403783DC